MPRKKDFWELADSTILGRTKKNELLQIARNERKQSETYRAEIELLSQQLADLNQLIDHLRHQLSKEGEVHRQVLQDLLETFEEQQHNHEQELERLQEVARDWETIAQNFEDVIVTQENEISYLKSFIHRIKQLAQMTPLQAGQALLRALTGSKADGAMEHCSSCEGIITTPEYRFCPHCGLSRQSSHFSQQA